MNNFLRAVLQLLGIWLIVLALLPIFGVGILFMGLSVTGVFLIAVVEEDDEEEEDSE